MSDDTVVTLSRVMAWSLADDNPAEGRGPAVLEQLARLVPALPRELLQRHAADVLACWLLAGRTLPPAVVEAALAAVDGDAGEGAAASAPDALGRDANAFAVRAIAARLSGAAAPAMPAHLRPPDGDWIAVADWFARAACLALPGKPALPVAPHALALVRAVALALLDGDLARAGALLRWLVIAPTPLDRATANALSVALERTRALAAQAFPTLAAYRLWLARRDKKLGDGPIVPPAPPSQHHGAPAPLIEAAIAWLVAHLDDFAAAHASFRKLGELGLVGDLLLREGERRARPEWREIGRRFVERAWAELDGGARLLQTIESDPTRAINVTVYWPLHRHGLRNAALEKAIAAHAHAIPRPLAYLAALPLREMDLPSPWTPEESFGWTVAGRAQPPWRLTSLEVYLVTHIAFYEVEFRRAGEPLRSRAYLTRWLPVWLRHYETLGLADLLAEMIVAWHCAEDVCCEPRAWTALAAAQRPDGSVQFSRAGQPADDYHSTLVSVLAALWCRH